MICRFFTAEKRRRTIARTKKHYIGFKLNDEEYKKISDKIASSKLSISSFMLKAALGKDIVIVEEVKEFTKQLSKIGTNLNQLTILAHKGNINTVYLNETKEALNQIYKELTRIRR